jgi:hypothetical protein
LTISSQFDGLGSGQGERIDRKGRVVALRASQARSEPTFGTRYEVRTQRVPLDVTHDLVEILVRLHRKRLITLLVEVAVTDLVAVLLPPFHVGIGQLLHEAGQVPVAREIRCLSPTFALFSPFRRLPFHSSLFGDTIFAGSILRSALEVTAAMRGRLAVESRKNILLLGGWSRRSEWIAARKMAVKTFRVWI